MASTAVQSDSDDGMDEFMDKFKTQRYKKGFNEDTWEEEFDKIPMFMKEAPENINPREYPDLACLQSMIHDEDRPPEEQAKSLKNEGNAYFKERSYKQAVVSYTAALKVKCGDEELRAVILTNRAASHFHLGIMSHGAQCCIELRNFAEAVQWCDEGLKVHPTDKKLQELRAAAEKHKRTAERDARKAKAKEKKLHGEKEALLVAIKDRGIKLLPPAGTRVHGSNSDDEDAGSPAAIAQLSLDGLSSQEVTGAQVFLDQQGLLHWPVLFLYPEHQQTDFISAFCENTCFRDHLTVMFGEELPPWDTDRKYHPQNLQLYFEDEVKQTLYQVDPDASLLRILQHKRFFVKAGTPSFIVLVKGSSFWKTFLSEKKIHIS
ncbi:tetratricopeptide repeat protein 4 isoform X2 [Nothobranchius furzeri]|uniref:Transcript variant X2 n=2 Tax=Nothobranchius furzeri TaxID=105023 RepID=A0A9D2XI52_NOTFU|nr:transcript variant X2 [Nothobranchius furzeri]